MMSWRARLGRKIILVIIGSELLYELAAFLDGHGGLPTESQLTKHFERAHGIAARFAVGAALVGVAITLFAHLVWPTF